MTAPLEVVPKVIFLLGSVWPLRSAHGTQSVHGQVPNACDLLALRCTACQLLHFALGRTASIFAGLQRVIGLALLPRRALGLLTFFFRQFACVCHECCLLLLIKIASSC
jgi:hypothetical protein